MSRSKAGYLLGLGAYITWGLLPFYWKLISEASAFEILAHRGVWALVLCIGLLAARKQLGNAFAILRNKRSAVILFAAAGFLTANWGVYIWSVTVNRVVEAALGYYINPLIAVCFGVLMLKEKLRRLQWISVALAAIGVIILTVGYGSLPWIALVLAVTWGMYGLLKKTLNAGALETLSIETLFTLTPNFIYLMLIESQGRAAFGHGWATTLLLIFGGGATIAPLLMWNGAVLRLPLSVIGLLQYLTPTIMFFIGIYANHEDMSVTKLFGFMFIWSALILLGTDAVKNSRNSSGAVEDL